MTDEAHVYKPIGGDYIEHGVEQHGIGQYVRSDIHTNTIEGYFAIFKRGMKGVYQHCNFKHLKRYLAEFDFRYNNRGINDMERTVNALSCINGKWYFTGDHGKRRICIGDKNGRECYKIHL